MRAPQRRPGAPAGGIREENQGRGGSMSEGEERIKIEIKKEIEEERREQRVALEHGVEK